MKPPTVTHADLVRKAVAYLRYRVPCVLWASECNITSEVPDAVGWTCHGECVVVECKASRSDFLSDMKKPHRSGPGLGHRRLYLAPEGIVKADELPEGWGLLALRGRSVVSVRAAYRRPAHDERANAALLLHLARRACDYDPAKLHARIEAERARRREVERRHRDYAREFAAARDEQMARLKARFDEAEPAGAAA